MLRKARILPAAMLSAWLVSLAPTPSPAIDEGPALTKAAADEAADAQEAAADDEAGAADEAHAMEGSKAAGAVADDGAGRAAEPGTAAPETVEEPGPGEAPDVAETTDAAEEPDEADEPAEPDEPPPPPLTPEMIALRDKLRKARAVAAALPFNTRDNTPGEMILLSLAFGCDAGVGYNGPSGKKINALGCLCWNYPCAGYRLLRAGGGTVMARVGYGLQAHSAQFLAVLAQSRVPADYEVRVGEYRGTVADLVEFEKRACRAGSDLSFTLIGLAHYVDDGASWENRLGEEWSVERLVREELARTTSTSDSDATNRLMGLSFAVRRREKRGGAEDDVFGNVRRYLGKFHDFALEVQNPDGTWHPGFFARKGTSRDAAGTLRSTGHIVQWLASSLPEDRLQDPRVLRSVVYLIKALGTPRSRTKAASMSLHDVDGVMHAAHALAIYDRRVFASRAGDEPADEAAEAVASRTTPE